MFLKENNLKSDSKKHVYINMHFYCNIRDKEVKTKLKNHRVCGKVVQTHTINNPKISDINRSFHDYTINHKKKIFKLMRFFLKMNLKLKIFTSIILHPLT